MQNLNNTNNTNNRYHVTKRLSPLGYGVVGIIGLLILVFFGRLLLLLAVIGGIGWLIWKFRWAIQYYYEQISRKISTKAQAYQQKCQNNQHSQHYYSAQCSNPFKTSRQDQPSQAINTGWRAGSNSSAGHRNAIFDVTPDKENT